MQLSLCLYEQKPLFQEPPNVQKPMINVHMCTVTTNYFATQVYTDSKIFAEKS